MGCEVAKAKRWAIILAGGDGERLRPLTMRWLGRHQPKQYCTFVGSRSMLQHTLDRAVSVVDADRVVTVMGKGHRGFLDRSCRRPIPGRMIEQPVNRDTAPGLFLPASYVLAVDPSATVLVFPSDHFIFPEKRFLRQLESAALAAERFPARLVLLAVTPRSAETEYGWIAAASPLGRNADEAARPALSFYEKPGRNDAMRFYRRGYLWNTLIMAAKIATLWSLGWRFLPDIMRRFENLVAVLGRIQRGAASVQEELTALSHVYACLGCASFSRDILQRAPDQILVLEMRNVHWDDWGRPERIVESLARLDCRPYFLHSHPDLCLSGK